MSGLAVRHSDRGPDGIRQASPQHACGMGAPPSDATGYLARRFDRSPSSCCRSFTLATNGSASHRLRPVGLPARHHALAFQSIEGDRWNLCQRRPDDPGHPVGQRHRHDLARLAGQQPQQLGCGMPLPRLDQSHHRRRPLHQQLAQPFVALARDPPMRCLPPVECPFGVSQIQAAKCRPDWNCAGSMPTARVSAVTGPMPGTAANCWLSALALC